MGREEVVGTVEKTFGALSEESGLGIGMREWRRERRRVKCSRGG